ncbi:unnamed protein product, partial [Ostreobium quekettii]
GVGATVCCPGPIAPFKDGVPNVEIRPDGSLAFNRTSLVGPMNALRVSELIATAAAYGLDESWVSQQPLLFMGHAMQSAPGLGWNIIKLLGPARVRRMKAGLGGDAFGEIIRGKASALLAGLQRRLRWSAGKAKSVADEL